MTALDGCFNTAKRYECRNTKVWMKIELQEHSKCVMHVITKIQATARETFEKRSLKRGPQVHGGGPMLPGDWGRSNLMGGPKFYDTGSIKTSTSFMHAFRLTRASGSPFCLQQSLLEACRGSGSTFHLHQT